MTRIALVLSSESLSERVSAEQQAAEIIRSEGSFELVVSELEGRFITSLSDALSISREVWSRSGFISRDDPQAMYVAEWSLMKTNRHDIRDAAMIDSCRKREQEGASVVCFCFVDPVPRELQVGYNIETSIRKARRTGLKVNRFVWDDNRFKQQG